MVERFGEYEQDKTMPDTNARLDDLADRTGYNEKMEEILKPKNPKEVFAALQKFATQKSGELDATFSSSEINNDLRGKITVEQKSGYNYIISSYGIKTPVICTPTVDGSIQLAISMGNVQVKSLSINVASLEDTDLVDFIGWVNSINKLIALNKDYINLTEKIPELLGNKNNNASFAKYYDTYKTTMKKGFVLPRVSTSFPLKITGLHIAGMSSEVTEYLNMRRMSIKENQRSKLNAMFKKEGFAPIEKEGV